jgi:phosphoglycerate dehydrogenase-like enzyme
MIDYSMKYHIYRTHLSGYWPNNFLDLEASIMQTLPACTYHGLELDSSKWLPHSIILSNTHFNPDKVSISDWEKVDLVLHANSGFDNLLQGKFLDNYHGPILIAPILRAQAVAEYNLQAWLLGLGSIPFQKAWDKTRKFKRRLAQNERVLLLGFGHVGKATHQMVQATGAKVDVYDPYVDTKIFGGVNFIQDIYWSDYDSIIFCASLTSSSKTLMGDVACWNTLKKHVCLINATRGPLLNLNLVIPFAKKNPEAKIFLDVYEHEPFQEFEKLPPNIYTTSHIAGVYDNLLDQTHQWHVEAIQDFLRVGAKQLVKNRPWENLRTLRLEKN